MKYIFLTIVNALLIFSITGCDDSTSEPEMQEPQELTAKMPPGMTSCKAYRIYVDNWPTLAIRCPNSTVITDNGKSGKTITGEEEVEEVE